VSTKTIEPNFIKIKTDELARTSDKGLVELLSKLGLSTDVSSRTEALTKILRCSITVEE
jgi:hypothetical protein